MQAYQIATALMSIDDIIFLHNIAVSTRKNGDPKWKQQQ